jgi:Flp pilus assembly protein TadG
VFFRQSRSSPAEQPGLFSRFQADTRGNIAVIFALLLPMLLGVSALVAEYGYSLSVQANNQRTADLAAYAGALAYTSASSTTLMSSAAKRVGELNGIAPANVAVDLVTSPRNSANRAVRAVVTVDNSLFLAPILGVSNSVRIVTISYAEIGAGVSGCVIALDATKTGITLSGGTRITASTCSVSSNAKVDVPCGTTITAKSVSYNTTVSQPCTGITASSITKTATTDPLAGNAAIATARARFTTLAGQTSPAAPSVTAPTGGYAIDFAYNDTSTKAQATAAGCTASKSGSTWTLTCPQGTSKVYNFSNVTFGGGINFSFNPSGTAGTTYNFSGPLTLVSTNVFGPGNYNFGGAVGATSYGSTTFGAGNYNFAQTFNTGGSGTVTFGAGTYNFAKGMATAGSVVTSFGAGTFNMGRSATTCSGSTFSLCNTSSGATTFAGPSTFKFQGGMANGGGSTLTMGSGTTNIFQFGPSGAGDAINLGGGSKTYLADASTFELGGNLWGPNGGGSCLVISAAAQHDIRGNFNVAGGVVMGAGVYTIDGYYALGANGGGGSPCTGYTISVKATDVNIVLSGKSTPSSGSCSGMAFCVAAGYSNIEITAPSTGTLAKLAVIGPATLTAGATFAEGGSGGKISGAFYFPSGPITMSGGAGVSGGSYCLQLIGSLISLSGGTTAASECIAAAGGGSARPRLVQ